MRKESQYCQYVSPWFLPTIIFRFSSLKVEIESVDVKKPLNHFNSFKDILKLCDWLNFQSWINLNNAKQGLETESYLKT